MILRCPVCPHQGRWTPDEPRHLDVDLQMVQAADGRFVCVPAYRARCSRCGYQWPLTEAEIAEGESHELAVVIHMTRYALGMRPYGKRHEPARAP